MKRWNCPTGKHPGVNAPARMRKKDIRRYCIPCSLEIGFLVDRVAPALERARTEADETRRVEKAALADYAEEVRLAYPHGWLREWWKRVARLKSWGRDLGPERYKARFRASRPRVFRVARQVRDGHAFVDSTGKRWESGEKIPAGVAAPAHKMSTGRAWYFGMRFAVTAGTDRVDALATLLHELAHLATPNDRGHGDAWRSVFFAACEEALGVSPTLRGRGNRYDVHRAVYDAVAKSGAAEAVDPKTWKKEIV